MTRSSLNRQRRGGDGEQSEEPQAGVLFVELPAFRHPSLILLVVIGERVGGKNLLPRPAPSSLLDDLFGESTISWIHRHSWDSYPYLTPTTRFPHIHVDEGLYYPNAMESLVSTMETSTVAAKNAVGLLLSDWYGDEFVNGKDCKWGVEDWTRDPMENVNWAGWGCNSG